MGQHGPFLVRTLFLACGQDDSSLTSCGLSSVRALEQSSSSYKATNPIGIGLHPYDHIYLLITSISNYSHVGD